ncbi:MAG TPA: hypothetical protein VNB06_16650 [Thermoanaerobaculia bacterium]|nr:hypothetical protein [Thermoanaerobaculia bacterium]
MSTRVKGAALLARSAFVRSELGDDTWLDPALRDELRRFLGSQVAVWRAAQPGASAAHR